MNSPRFTIPTSGPIKFRMGIDAARGVVEHFFGDDFSRNYFFPCEIVDKWLLSPTMPDRYVGAQLVDFRRMPWWRNREDSETFRHNRSSIRSRDLLLPDVVQMFKYVNNLIQDTDRDFILDFYS